MATQPPDLQSPESVLPVQPTPVNVWTMVQDDESKEYYWLNSVTGESSWDTPADVASTISAPPKELKDAPAFSSIASTTLQRSDIETLTDVSGPEASSTSSMQAVVLGMYLPELTRSDTASAESCQKMGFLCKLLAVAASLQPCEEEGCHIKLLASCKPPRYCYHHAFRCRTHYKCH